eukprot:209601-Pelagomonas_calceolata.AAC.1
MELPSDGQETGFSNKSIACMPASPPIKQASVGYCADHNRSCIRTCFAPPLPHALRNQLMLRCACAQVYLLNILQQPASRTGDVAKQVGWLSRVASSCSCPSCHQSFS